MNGAPLRRPGANMGDGAGGDRARARVMEDGEARAQSMEPPRRGRALSGSSIADLRASEQMHRGAGPPLDHICPVVNARRCEQTARDPFQSPRARAPCQLLRGRRGRHAVRGSLSDARAGRIARRADSDHGGAALRRTRSSPSAAPRKKWGRRPRRARPRPRALRGPRPLLDGAGVVRGRAHVLSSASVGPLGRLIVLGAGMQTCARTCAMGEDAAWMCVDPAEWRASLRRSENASQAEA